MIPGSRSLKIGQLNNILRLRAKCGVDGGPVNGCQRLSTQALTGVLNRKIQ